jgi:D-alanyl-D-alanine carboxypeptidase/D-alanyl-D-alanine-endopeptidase (penicillin-binding protein 4)
VAQVAGVNLGFNCISVAVSGGPGGSAAAARLVPATAYFSLSNTARQGTQSALGLGRVPGTNNLRLSGQRPAKGGDIFVNVTLHDPPAYAATLLSERLKRAGIQVTGVPAKSRDMRGLYMSAQGQFRNVLVHETPLAGVLARINKDSANLYAESLLKRLGAARSNQPGGWDNGRAAAASFLASIAVPADHYAIDDGCGLSRQNRLSPEALVRLHANNLRSAYRDAFLASLSVGGEDGTLRRRFTGDLDGRVFGKTGYIRGVSTLSGVLKTKSGKWYAFAVMHNELPGSVGGAKAAQDRVVAAIDAHGN